MKPNAPWEGISLGRTVAAVLAAALIASAAVTGLLYAVGVAGGSTRTVVMSSGETPDGSGPAGALDASSLYRSAAPGAVAIEATGTSSGSNNGFPYTPPGQGVDTGTGIVIDTRGDILTASHVVGLQTDAALNPGNSGGPVLDPQGQVVGIADQIATGGSGVDQGSGVGFAIPIDPVKAELSALESGQTVEHPHLGAGLQAASINRQGAQVQSVAPGSPAAGTGLRAGDLTTALDGSTVNGPSQLMDDLAALKPGDKVTLAVTRRSKTIKLTATVVSQPSRPPAG